MTIDEFVKSDLRVGTVVSATRVEGSSKLLQLLVDLSEKNEAGEATPRQILAGIGTAYEPEALIGKQLVVVANLDPRPMMGTVSYGMVLAATNAEGVPVVLAPMTSVAPGAKIK